jgi:hypothetical protein
MSLIKLSIASELVVQDPKDPRQLPMIERLKP